MGEARIKAATPMISVLIPERGRPEMLERLIQSLISNSGGDLRFEVLISIDDDDPEWKDKPPHEPYSATRPVLWFHGPRAATLGIKINELAAQARGEILWFVSNDMTMETFHWPAKFRQAVSKLPNGIGYPFVHDDLHPNHASYPIMTRKMVDAIGFMFAPWFGGGWFIDTWADQCGLLLGVRPEIDVTVNAPEGRGKSHGLIDITFWSTFFREMAPFRSRDALGLAKLAYGQDSAEYADVKARLPEREALCEARTRHLITPEFAEVWEANAASPPGPHYEAVKANAEEMLRNVRAAKPKQIRVAIAVPSTETWRGTTANCIAALSAHSALAGLNLAFLNVQSSQVSHGRNTTVKIAMQEDCDYIMWIDSDMRVPPNALVRLLAHDKDIVGGTYNKRVPPYETLGKLKGSHPEHLDDGIREAELLPGGLLLVKMDVYRKLKWPWYAECFRWSGDDGLDAFKAMLRDYLKEVPPVDVLDSLNDTAFGAWIKHNYSVGNGEYPMFSEDLTFCTKARRAGYQIWCDIKLTGECAHLGELPVTCELGPEIERLAEAAD